MIIESYLEIIVIKEVYSALIPSGKEHIGGHS